VSPDETREFEEAVNYARERLDDLRPLLVVANQLDRAAEEHTAADGQEDGPA
jgi:hypothetical protein